MTKKVTLFQEILYVLKIFEIAISKEISLKVSQKVNELEQNWKKTEKKVKFEKLETWMPNLETWVPKMEIWLSTTVIIPHLSAFMLKKLIVNKKIKNVNSNSKNKNMRWIFATHCSVKQITING